MSSLVVQCEYQGATKTIRLKIRDFDERPAQTIRDITEIELVALVMSEIRGAKVDSSMLELPYYTSLIGGNAMDWIRPTPKRIALDLGFSKLLANDTHGQSVSVL